VEEVVVVVVVALNCCFGGVEVVADIKGRQKKLVSHVVGNSKI